MGFLLSFYQKNWDVIKTYLMGLVCIRRIPAVQEKTLGNHSPTLVQQYKHVTSLNVLPKLQLIVLQVWLKRRLGLLRVC
jgi:hypothetical protein